MSTGLPLWFTAGILILGIALLVFSAEKTVQKTLDLAYHFGLSEVFIGLTVLSIGTSIPEISSNIIGGFGILSGQLDPGIASATVLGANVGSSIVQQTLIIGVITLLIGRLKFKRLFLAENYIALIVAFLVVFVLSYDGAISRSDAMIMLIMFGLYLYFLYRQEHAHRQHHYEKIKKGSLINPRRTGGWLLLGFGGIFLGSSIALETVQAIVTATGISGSLLGVMTLGVASALPEFITSISAVRKNAEGISIGTLIGSNIVNPLMGIGAGGIIAGYVVPHAYISWDLPVQIITASILLLWINRHHRIMPKSAGIILILIYIIYLLTRMYRFSTDF